VTLSARGRPRAGGVSGRSSARTTQAPSRSTRRAAIRRISSVSATWRSMTASRRVARALRSSRSRSALSDGPWEVVEEVSGDAVRPLEPFDQHRRGDVVAGRGHRRSQRPPPSGPAPSRRRRGRGRVLRSRRPARRAPRRATQPVCPCRNQEVRAERCASSSLPPGPLRREGTVGSRMTRQRRTMSRTPVNGVPRHRSGVRGRKLPTHATLHRRSSTPPRRACDSASLADESPGRRASHTRTVHMTCIVRV
jgi:hypothetical protein